MSSSRVRYRIRQFFHAVWAEVDPDALARARTVLSPAQMALFVGMQRSEQAHALEVYRQLVAQGETAPDLLVAALLHDVGKSCRPLRLWERVLIVLTRAVFPAQARRWGIVPPQAAGRITWKRAFVVAEQHPAWGAELAARAGTSPRAVALIRLHQDPLSPIVDAETQRLLSKLQAVDDFA
jgi:exopolyphosphatase/pppGpp-phosphohydrolase